MFLRHFVFLLAFVAAAAQAQLASFNLVDVDIKSVAQAVQHFSGQTVEVDSDVIGRVSFVTPQPLSGPEAVKLLAALARLQGWRVEGGDGGPLKIHNPGMLSLGSPTGEQLITKVYPLLHIAAAQASPSLRNVLSLRGRLIAANDGALWVIDDARVQAQVEQLLSQIDVPSSSLKDPAPAASAARAPFKTPAAPFFEPQFDELPTRMALQASRQMQTSPTLAVSSDPTVQTAPAALPLAAGSVQSPAPVINAAAVRLPVPTPTPVLAQILPPVQPQLVMPEPTPAASNLVATANLTPLSSKFEATIKSYEKKVLVDIWMSPINKRQPLSGNVLDEGIQILAAAKQLQLEPGGVGRLRWESESGNQVLELDVRLVAVKDGQVQLILVPQGQPLRKLSKKRHFDESSQELTLDLKLGQTVPITQIGWRKNHPLQRPSMLYLRVNPGSDAVPESVLYAQSSPTMALSRTLEKKPQVRSAPKSPASAANVARPAASAASRPAFAPAPTSAVSRSKFAAEPVVPVRSGMEAPPVEPQSPSDYWSAKQKKIFQ